MGLMLLGLLIFLGSHSLPMAVGLHKRLKAIGGDIAYRIVYSVVSLGGLILIAEGYKAWRYVDGAPFLYFPPPFLSHIALLLMAFSFILFVATYGKSHIKKVVKHPMLAAVKIWAFAHLLANGDAAGVVLFGSFLAWAVVDRISVKRRERAGVLAPADFQPTFRDDAIAVTVGLVVYVLFVWHVHMWLIGVSPIVMGSPTTQ
ncbi:MAG: NnrU family protein [Pseudomonadota bacterium]